MHVQVFWHDESADTTAFGGSASIMHLSSGLNLTVASADNDAGFDYWFVQGGIKNKYVAAGKTHFLLVTTNQQLLSA